MSKTADDSEKVRWWPWLIGVIAFYIGYWYVIWISGWFPELEKGEFGDTFGALNALFAGLAFAGVIWAILLQRKELELQRQELKDTRAEIRGQKEQLQAQNQTLQQQNFESSFFQLLSMHSEIVNSLEIQGDREYSGRECFGHMLISLQGIYMGVRRFHAARHSGDAREFMYWANDKYERFFADLQPYVGHYFRHLYNVVKFVDQSDFSFEAKKFYTNLIRAQLSSNELGVLLFYGLRDQGAEFKDLVEKYALLEDMPSEVFMAAEYRDKIMDDSYMEYIQQVRGLYAQSAYGESE